MNITNKILQSIPLFSHCSTEELSYLKKVGRLSNIKSGSYFDLRKTNSLNIVINGMFEIEGVGKSDIVYLSQGSFFGAIPLTTSRQYGSVKALINSTLLMFSEEDIFKLFIVSYKGLRGYLKVIEKLGFETSEIGKKYYSQKSKVVTVYSQFRECGKTFLSSILGISLSSKKKTIILDTSYKGNSVFNFFDKKLTSPLSHKKEDSSHVEKVIKEKIEKVNDSLYLMNISFGSKVKVAPDILSPILFILSKEFEYIILDVSDYDPDLRDKSLVLSDIVFAFVRKQKEFDFLYNLFDTRLNDFQKVYYVLNEFYSGKLNAFEGGLILNKYDVNENKYGFFHNMVQGEDDFLKEFTDEVTRKNRALVLETNLFESISFFGILNNLQDTSNTYNSIYSSSFSSIVVFLYTISRDEKEFKERIKSFFSEKRLNSFLDIVFPEENIFKRNKIEKFSAELCGNNRVEKFMNLPVTLLNDSNLNKEVNFSTGYLKDLLAASFLLYPVFESIPIGENNFNSGYPFSRVRPETLFRTDVDEITFVKVNNTEIIKIKEDKVLTFYKKYLEFLQIDKDDSKIYNLSDSSIVIDLSESKLRIENILKTSKEISSKLMKVK
ncbi:hypothetical protein ACFL20_13280 [Spirochaetota bacterium]